MLVCTADSGVAAWLVSLNAVQLSGASCGLNCWRFDDVVSWLMFAAISVFPLAALVIIYC